MPPFRLAVASFRAKLGSMSKWLIVLSLALPVAASAATVWTWVDDNGVRHYSDRPVDGAEEMQLGEVQGFSPPAGPDIEPSRSGGEEDSEQQQGQSYRTLRIANPEETETLWNIEGTLDVSVEIEPSLRSGHVIDVYLDGERQRLDSRETSLTIDEVYRGVHSLEAVVLDSGGRELMRSSTRNFVVQQTSLLNSNNPNTSPPGAN